MMMMFERAVCLLSCFFIDFNDIEIVVHTYYNYYNRVTLHDDSMICTAKATATKNDARQQAFPAVLLLSSRKP